MSELGYTRDEIRETIRSEDSSQRAIPASVGVAYYFFPYEQRNRRRQVKME